MEISTKTVYFIRHGKSSWSDPFVLDVERPLNWRGLRDAPFMANLFKGREGVPDKLISSHAERAYSTAQFFAEIMNIPQENIDTDAGLYLCSEEYILTVIKHLPEEYNSICYFGHNPTMTTLANIFSEEYIVNVPTCAIIKIQAEVSSWEEFNASTANFISMDYPKQYFT